MIHQFIDKSLLFTTFLTSAVTLSIVLFLLNQSKKQVNNLLTTMAANLGIPMSDLGVKNKVKGEISGLKRGQEAIARDNLTFFWSKWKEKNPELVLGSSLLQQFNITNKDFMEHIEKLIHKKPLQMESYLLKDMRTGGGLMSTLLGKSNLTPTAENPSEAPKIPTNLNALLNLGSKNQQI